jgi:hypothetical protein
MLNFILFSEALLNSAPLPKADNNDVLNIFNLFYAIFGIIAVLMVVYASIQLIISQGNAEKVATARRNVIFSIVGLIVIASAGAIIGFIIGQVAK